MCVKFAYPTKKDAVFELERIRSKSHNQEDHKIPVRSYECEFCNQWHLTSLPYEEWKIKQRQFQHA